jgi:hypothetical protein
MNDVRFLILLRTAAEERLARIAVESLRTFGGALCDCPVWAFVLDPGSASEALLGITEVHRFSLAVEKTYGTYPFASKVEACARAEGIAGTAVRTLVWMSPDLLVVNPPLLLNLGDVAGRGPADVAFRPVHHRNIGSLASEPPDEFWQGIYRALGIEEIPYSVESFADRQTLRPYFNTHCFAYDPAKGLAQVWREAFKALVSHQAFQAGPCHDELHRVFLHQAVLSTLASAVLDWERVRLLPSEYNYPLNLLDEISRDRRTQRLEDLVSVVHEGEFPWDEIEVGEPWAAWLAERMSGEREGAGP